MSMAGDCAPQVPRSWLDFLQVAESSASVGVLNSSVFPLEERMSAYLGASEIKIDMSNRKKLRNMCIMPLDLKRAPRISGQIDARDFSSVGQPLLSNAGCS